MGEKEKNERDRELDRFWDIDALIPKRQMPHYPRDTSAADIILEPTEPAKAKETASVKDEKAPVRHYIPPHTAEEETKREKPEKEYAPKHSLIHSVRIYPCKSSYRYYENFLRNAERLYAVKGELCERATFFSYVPQYAQMTREQLQWYLYWRECFRAGKCIDTDYSYLLLYAYEVINLDGGMDPADGQTSLCRLWLSYRDVFRQLDNFLPEWICDYSLLHELPAPRVFDHTQLLLAMSHCAIREFYIGSGEEEGTAPESDGYLNALLLFCSNYDYQKSKFCTPENQPLYRKTIYGALREVIRNTQKDGDPFSAAGMDDSKLTREAYTGALLVWSVKRRIEISYCSFSCSHELRFLLTDIVKYTENRVRGAIGVRARLGIFALPVPVRNILDAYLDKTLPTRAAQPKRGAEEPAPEYEKLYDLPRTPLSAAEAARIETESWGTTERLIEAFGDAEREPEIPEEKPRAAVPPQPIPHAAAAIEADKTDIGGFLPYLPFLQAAYEENNADQIAFAKKIGKMTDAVADEINGIAAELYGDILLEEADEGYAVIPDYRDTVRELLSPAGKDMGDKNG